MSMPHCKRWLQLIPLLLLGLIGYGQRWHCALADGAGLGRPAADPAQAELVEPLDDAGRPRPPTRFVTTASEQRIADFYTDYFRRRGWTPGRDLGGDITNTGSGATYSFNIRDSYSGSHGYTLFIWVERTGACQGRLVELDYTEYDSVR